MNCIGKNKCQEHQFECTNQLFDFRKETVLKQQGKCAGGRIALYLDSTVLGENVLWSNYHFSSVNV